MSIEMANEEKQKKIEEIKKIIDERCEAKLDQVHSTNGKITKTVDTSLIAQDIVNAGYGNVNQAVREFALKVYELMVQIEGELEVPPTALMVHIFAAIKTKVEKLVADVLRSE